MIIKRLLYQLLFALFSIHGGSIVAMNLLRPYDFLIRPDLNAYSSGQLAVFGEHGFKAHGFNDCGGGINVLRIWNQDQDSLKMLQGFELGTDKGQLAVELRADGANDDGIRGHFDVCGDLTMDSFAFSGYYHFLDSWFFSVYMPFYYMELKNVSWVNKTLNVSAGDQSVRTKLTDNFFKNVRLLGDGLELGDWQRFGPGDLVTFIEWMTDFRQNKPLLNNVRVDWRLGFNFPTGLRQDIDKTFALPFGSNGAFGIIGTFGLDLTFGNYLKIGGNVELRQLFGHTTCYRIKTDPDQTELLLLAKAPAYRDYGLQQTFNLYTQFYNLKGFDCKIAYQFNKRGDDILSLRNQAFSNNVANTARSLEDWTSHQIILKGTYDFTMHMAPNNPLKPVAALFARLPFNGKHVALCPTFGGYLAINF